MKSSHFDILLSMSLKGISTKRRKKERWAARRFNTKMKNVYNPVITTDTTNDNILHCEQIINH